MHHKCKDKWDDYVFFFILKMWIKLKSMGGVSGATAELWSQ